MKSTGSSALAILTAEKSFSHRWVGHAELNRLGLHLARLLGSAAVASVRRASCRVDGALEAGDRRMLETALADLEERGVAVVPAPLPPSDFERLRTEVEAYAALVRQRAPFASPVDRGFGPRRPFEGGFDRYDGSTLNRFLTIDAVSLPRADRWVNSPWVASLAARGVGIRSPAPRFFVHETVQGDESENPDVQKRLHRDTFQPALKVWYFLQEVRPEDGPLEYVVGSQRLGLGRLRWEHGRALRASRRGAPDTGGSFRIDAETLAELGLPKPTSLPVAANTLVIADVRGFHRRGSGRAAGRRLALHASLRPPPFVPFAR